MKKYEIIGNWIRKKHNNHVKVEKPLTLTPSFQKAMTP